MIDDDHQRIDQSKKITQATDQTAADILYRPRLPKKKQNHSNKKSNKNYTKEKSISNQIQGEDNEGNKHIDDDELIEKLLNQTAEMSLSPSSPEKSQQAENQSSNNSSIKMSTSISRRIQGLGEDLKEVAHAVSPVTLINSKRKPNRQKDKIAKRQAAQLQAQLDAQLELANNPVIDQRKLEADGMTQTCKSLNLQVVDITPDGHCLYSAIADQLNLKDPSNGPYDYKICRKLASDYMREHSDEFIHYLPAQDDGLEDGLMCDADYHKYCDLVRDSARWGGEPEILALSKSLKFSIHIIQAFQPIMKISQDEFYKLRGNKALVISYHRKSYGLGEHYNSLRPIS